MKPIRITSIFFDLINPRTAKLELLCWGMSICSILVSLTLFVVKYYDYKIYAGPYSISNIEHVGAFGYTAYVGRESWSSHQVSSAAEVLENGQPLKGMSTYKHEEISRLGRGRYSFWQGNVYFSSSDNTDPRSNGRKYEIRNQITVSNTVLITASLICIFILIFSLIISLFRRLSALTKRIITIIQVIILLTTISIVFTSYLFYKSRLFPEKPEILWNTERLIGIQAETGKAYIILRKPAEERTEQTFSVGKLIENGISIGLGNSSHETIRQCGGGTYSVWKNTLLFSTPDGSDPRTNGRQYDLKTPPSHAFLTGGLMFLTTLSVILLITLAILMKRGYSLNVKFGYAIILLILFPQLYFALPYSIHTQFKTLSYLHNFNARLIESRLGQSHVACASPMESDITVQSIRANLAGVIRSKSLRGIFTKITAGASTNTEKHLKVLKFIQKIAIHSSSPIKYANDTEILDPLLMIELGTMWCNQSSKLAIDLFEAAGYRGRQVQLGTHLVAEIFYDDNWHYFDADLFGNGETVRKDDGYIPSIRELGTPELLTRLDALASYQETLLFKCHPDSPQNYSLSYPSYFYFSELAYQDQSQRPGYYYKELTPEKSDLFSYYYGWMFFRYEADPLIIKSKDEKKHTPTIPSIEDVSIDTAGRRVTISFKSHDLDQDLTKYRIFVASKSRGWDYSQFVGRPDLIKYKTIIDFSSEDRYERLFEVPQSNLGLYDVSADDPTTTIELNGSDLAYISVMPIDAYGERVGRKIFPLSNELRIELE
jgi:hypothetical protein